MPTIISTGPDTPGVNYPVSANAITLPIFSIIFIFLLIVPFRLLYRVSNIAACSLVILNIISLIFTAMNALIWPTDALTNRFSGHVVCDIQVLIRQSLYTAMTSTTCCITMFLARAVDAENACMYETRAQKRRRVLKDCAFCFTIPILQVALHYTIQVNRYTVMTIYGCVDVTDLSWPSIVIQHMWPLIFACLNVYFSALVIYRLRRHRTNFTRTLSTSSSGLNPRRFLKLFSMSLILLVVYFPVVTYYFYLNVNWPYHSYSWSAVHDPAFWPLIVFWRISDAPSGMQYDMWNWVSLAFLIVIFWGCNSEGVEVYRRGLCKLGLARWWPRLRMTMEERKMEKMERDSRTEKSGWSSVTTFTQKLDFISKTMHYFEGQEAKSRKDSLATTTTLGDDVTRSSTRKPSNTKTYNSTSTSTSSNSGYNSRSTTIYSPSTHKRSIATIADEKDISLSSSAPTSEEHDPDTISPVPGTLSPDNCYSHVPELTAPNGAAGLTVPAPTSRGMWGMFRTRLNTLPISSFFSHNKKLSPPSSHQNHSHTNSNSHSQPKSQQNPSKNDNTIPPFSNTNTNATLTTQIWSSPNQDAVHKGSNAGLLVPEDSSPHDYANADEDEEEYDQEDILASPKPVTRAFRERERREMIEERKREGEWKDGEGLNVKREFEVVEERKSIGRKGSS